MKTFQRIDLPRSGVAGRYLAAAAIVIAASGLADILHHVLNTTRLSMVFLAGVVAAALTQGMGPAFLAAALAFLIYDFYLAEPRYQLAISSPEDVIVLMVFLLVAVTTGALAGRVRDDGVKAGARAKIAGALYEASRELSEIWDEARIRSKLAHHVAIAAKSPVAIWSPDGVFTATPDGDWVDIPADVVADFGTGALPTSPAEIRHGEVAVQVDGVRMRLLSDDSPEIGVAAWRHETPLDGDDDDRLVNVLINVGAAAILRARLGAIQSNIEAMARTEHLRNALLSSVSHDFRTPLAAILASASTLRDFPTDIDPATREDLLATIQEEAERLNRFVANLLQMSKLESGVVRARDAPVDLAEVIDGVARRYGRGRDEGRLRAEIAAAPLYAHGDPILLDHALGNIVENALRFGPHSTQVTIAGRREADRICIEVMDDGPGVSPRDLPRLFEKFFQAEGPRTESAGAGLGLSIAKGLIEAMRGDIRISNRVGASGLKVCLCLPAVP